MPVREIDYPNTGGPSKAKRGAPGVNDRVESGAVQFGDDWPGLFLRGDDAFAMALDIKAISDWFESLPEDTKKNAFGVWVAVRNLDGYRKTILEEVVK